MSRLARRPLQGRIIGLTRTPADQLPLLLEAAASLLAARVLLKTTRFPKLARRWGDFVPPSDPRAMTGPAPGSADDAVLAGKVRDAVRRAARNLPFGAVCLPRAMAARRMLERRSIPSVMHFGAAKGHEKPIDAHAWLDAAGVKVTGYPVPVGIVEIGCFIGRRTHPAADV